MIITINNINWLVLSTLEIMYAYSEPERKYAYCEKETEILYII